MGPAKDVMLPKDPQVAWLFGSKVAGSVVAGFEKLELFKILNPSEGNMSRL